MKTEEIRKIIEDAQDEVSAICKGKQWRMCIPYQRNDSDALIGGALRMAAKLVAVAEAADIYTRMLSGIESKVMGEESERRFKDIRKALAALEAGS